MTYGHAPAGAGEFRERWICGCDHRCPPERILRSSEFNHELACRVCALRMSGDATLDLAISELLDHRTGRLFGPDGAEFPLDSEDLNDVAWFDGLFPEDPRRFINRYKERAHAGRFSHRLQARLTEQVALIFLALEVRDCRMSGLCAEIRPEQPRTQPGQRPTAKASVSD